MVCDMYPITATRHYSVVQAVPLYCVDRLWSGTREDNRDRTVAATTDGESQPPVPSACPDINSQQSRPPQTPPLNSSAGGEQTTPISKTVQEVINTLYSQCD